jgi:hypothetical protein
MEARIGGFRRHQNHRRMWTRNAVAAAEVASPEARIVGSRSGGTARVRAGQDAAACGSARPEVATMARAAVDHGGGCAREKMRRRWRESHGSRHLGAAGG